VKNKHIDTIRRNLGIPLASIQKYNREHKSEIEHIKDIFTLKGDYKEKYLALLYMFCSDTEDIVKRYREQKGLNKAEYEPSVLLEQYKVLLITALIYNRDFYAMVINDIGFAGAGIGIGNEEEKPEKIEAVRNDEYEVKTVSNYYVFTFFLPIHRQAAAGEGNFTEFYKRPFSHKGICGTLHFWGNDQQEVYIEFVFDEFMSIIPFELELCFTTSHDHKKHASIAIPAGENRIIKDREKNITILKSDIISGVDYSEGIESNYTVQLKELL
jgi:hypothetical protein